MSRFGLAVLLCSSSLAAAQEMPDPRQMSGMPRPDEAVAPGSVTVRVIHGDFGSPAKVGTPVTLVSIKADGTTEKTVGAVGEDGRAEFKGLVPGGEVAYYAYAMLGEDRLESDLISLPPMVGIRLMLVGRKLDEHGAPVGEPADDHEAEKTTPPPPGQVEVMLKARSVLPVELVEVPAAGQPAAKPVAVESPSGEEEGFGIVTFKGVSSAPDKVYVARTRERGRLYQSKPFQLRPNAGARSQILAFGQILVGLHMGGDLDDDRFRFEARFFLGNLSGLPYDPGPEGVALPLPVGFAGARLEDETMNAKVKIMPGLGLVWTGVIPPGQRDVTVQWSQEVSGGAVAIDLPAPLGIFQGQIILEHFPGTTIVPPPGAKVNTHPLETGRDFYVLSPIQTAPGGRVQVRLEGLPEAPTSQRVVRLVISLLVVLLCGFAMWMAIRAPRGGDPTTRKLELARARDRLYDQLVHLEKQRAADRIDLDRFRRERGHLVAKLALLHRELDELEIRK